MKKMYKSILALALAFAMVLSLCANGSAVFATSNSNAESRKDAIIKEFFGDGVSTEEAFNKLLKETETMNGYVNEPFLYQTNSKSYYVAFGDETAAVTTRQKSTYVDMLAKDLGVSYKNFASAQMTIQEVYASITDNADEVKKADLITIGWSNYGATFFMCQYMAGKLKQDQKVTKEKWTDLVGEENLPLVDELLNEISKELNNNDVSDFGEYDLKGGLEHFAYAFLSNAILQSEIIEEIRALNADAVIVLVGTYNDLENVKLDVDGETVDFGALMNNLVNASNLLSSKNADAYRRVAYVHAPDVTTTLDGNVSNYNTPEKYVLAIGGRQSLPNSDGHTYIKNQIKASISDTCNHRWGEGAVTVEPTCSKQGELTYVCSWCGQSKSEKIDATGNHNYHAVVTEPTCKAGGYTTHTCADCGTSYQDSFTDPVDHSWDQGVVTKQPTTEEEGEMTYTCKHCGETRIESIDKRDPSDVRVGDVNGDGAVNTRDARLILRYIAGLVDESGINKDAADFNGDGQVNTRDARAVLRFIAGLS